MHVHPNGNVEITQICLLAGKIMLASGAETYRVEDTMMRIADAYGYENSHSYVTPTGIIFAINGAVSTTRLFRIATRSTDLQKVTLVNDISRAITRGELAPEEAYKKLKRIDSANLAYPVWLQIAAAAISSGCFAIMFRGTWPDFLPALIAGGVGFVSYIYVHRLIPIKFFAEFMAATITGLLSYFCYQAGLGNELDKIIISAVMPLVPGLVITNAVRDLMAGHLVSGLSKGAEAFLTAFAIGAGIAFVMSIY
ncbi:threonine/serine exporter family protein [Paenibacillus arenosi]|uniref:Threonine/serine exporter family protein n=1 Tax=Paenibacillus arenosi TaxID=2774142 RepID=A0ABR9AVJ7_9BACL|nr:threonine/serine exporter family protein [Paenibacillus arenosi]MBD8498027.1 threonine/serine exporter family protein [Paenibacillus arenosi]